MSTTAFQTTANLNRAFLDFCLRHLNGEGFKGTRVLDVGGHDFLRAFDLGYARGVICDPNAPDGDLPSNLFVQHKFFSEQLFEPDSFDVVIAKHILEHINQPLQFLNQVQLVLRQGGTLIIEVPRNNQELANASCTLFYHQHIMYFEEHTLRNLLVFGGFEVEKFEETENVYRVLARPTEVKKPKSFYINEEFILQMRQYQNRTESLMQNSLAFVKQNKRNKQIVCYGAGSTITLMLAWSPEFRDLISSVVDTSVDKHGKIISDTDLIVQSPDLLLKAGEDVLIASEMFFQEIIAKLKQCYSGNNLKCFNIFSELQTVNI
jgi:SAM-dependent methyltransferase